MAQDRRLRYAITPENHEKLLKIQAFAIIEGSHNTDLSTLINKGIELLINKVIEDLRNQGTKYSVMFAELLEGEDPPTNSG